MVPDKFCKIKAALSNNRKLYKIKLFEFGFHRFGCYS